MLSSENQTHTSTGRTYKHHNGSLVPTFEPTTSEVYCTRKIPVTGGGPPLASLECNEKCTALRISCHAAHGRHSLFPLRFPLMMCLLATSFFHTNISRNITFRGDKRHSQILRLRHRRSVTDCHTLWLRTNSWKHQRRLRRNLKNNFPRWVTIIIPRTFLCHIFLYLDIFFQSFMLWRRSPASLTNGRLPLVVCESIAELFVQTVSR